MANDNKNWPVLETWVGASGRQLPFQIWNGDGTKWDGTGFSLYLNAKLGELSAITNLALDAVDEASGSYRGIFTFTSAGEYDAQIKVQNEAGDTDFCEPLTIKVREVI